MVRLRLISLAVAAFICIGLIYLAVTGKFSAVLEVFGDSQVVKAEIEPDKPKPPPPPPPNRPPPPPPPEQTLPPPVIDMPAIAYNEPVTTVPDELPPAPLTGVTWLEQPNGRDFLRYFPDRANTRQQEGRAVVRCIVSAEGRLSCSVVSEDPPGWGFGEASLRVARHFRVAPMTADGRPTTGGTITRTIRWNLPDE